MITAETVRGLAIFEALDDEAVAFVCSAAADMHLRAGDWFIYEGEAAAFFVLIDGSFEVLKRYGTTLRQLAIRGPGDYIGEIPSVLDGPFIAGAKTLEPSRVMRLDVRDFRRLLVLVPPLRERIFETLLHRIEGIEEESAILEGAPIVIGRRDDPACHDVRDFLARNRQAFEWFDPLDGRTCERAGPIAPDEMPLVLLADGRRLARPTLVALAEGLEMKTRPERASYDVVVIGGGPAGLAAAVYGASEGLRTILFDGYATGGQAGTSSRIENYLGFPSGLSGDELAARAHAQAERFGAEIVVGREAVRIEIGSPSHRVVFGDGKPDDESSVEADAIVIATGVSYRKLDVPDIDRFLGAGLYYGAARTEARGMSGRDIILVGGGNSAGQAAMFFANYAKSVTILIRASDLKASMSQYLIDQLASKDNVEVRANGEIVGVEGEGRVETVRIRDRITNETAAERIDAIFVFIGADACTEWLPNEIVRDERGYVCTGRDVIDLIDPSVAASRSRDPYLLETSVPGIFAAGDVRHGSVKRVAAGVGEGSMSIAFVHAYLASSVPRG
jgi:thioredoxin reductase (NADPH)